jgi:molybdopterin adenylyltransferase
LVPRSKTAVVITVSDGVHKGTRADASGPAARHGLEKLNLEVDGPLVVPDEEDRIAETLVFAAARADLVVTTGGTGFGPRDVTPEATRRVMDREAPGIAELLRLRGLERTAFAALSRGLCGLRGRSLIINLPGSPKSVTEGLEALAPILGHALELAAGNTEHAESAVKLG